MIAVVSRYGIDWKGDSGVMAHGRPPGGRLQRCLSAPGHQAANTSKGRKGTVSTQAEHDKWLDEHSFTDPEAEVFTPNDDYDRIDNKEAPEPAGDDDADWVPGQTLLEAPDYGTMVRGKRTAKSKKYEAKTQSVLKAAALGALKHGDLPDAAAIFKYGPTIARSAGDLASENEHAAKTVDLLCAPDSPVVGLTITGLALVSQLYRNNQQNIEKLQEKRKLTRAERKTLRDSGQLPPKERPFKKITINGPFKLKFNIAIPTKFGGVVKMFTAGTKNPRALCEEVYQDQDLLKALENYGFKIVPMEATP